MPDSLSIPLNCSRLVAAFACCCVLAMAVNSRAERLQASPDCVEFTSAGRVNEGESFRTPLRAGLEFRLHPEDFGWWIYVNPPGDPVANYMEVVSPPYQSAPQWKIGPGYGYTASFSANAERHLQFTVTEADFRAASAIVRRGKLPQIADMLKTMKTGTLTLNVTGFALRRVVVPPDYDMDALSWITFQGKACWPK